MSLEQLIEIYQRLRTDCSRLEQDAIRIRREAEVAERMLANHGWDTPEEKALWDRVQDLAKQVVDD